MTIRGTILAKAKELTEGDREQTHGSPKANMDLFARLIAAYLGIQITGSQAAMIMALAKIARIKGNPAHEDSYVDAAAYIAIAKEVNGD